MTRIMALLVALVILGLLAQTAEASLPPEVRRDLQNIRKLTSLSFNKTTVNFEPVRSREETLEAFDVTYTSGDHLFAEYQRRFVWQGGRFYQESRAHYGGHSHHTEFTFDGLAQFMGTPGRSLIRNSRPSRHSFGNYFLPAAGLYAPHAPSRSTVTSLESLILHRMETDGRLSSVGRTDLDGRELIEVAIVRPNESQQRAMNLDLVQVRERMQQSAMPLEHHDRQIELIEERRELPPEVMEIFILDPALNHAVVRIEERYLDGTLLRLTRNSQFVELPDEGVWLPQRSETDIHWLDTNPSTVFAEPPARQIMQIEGGISLEPVPDDLFTLVYTEPGVRITDYFAGDYPLQFEVAEGEEDQVRALLTLDPRDTPRERLAEPQDAMARDTTPESTTSPEAAARTVEAEADVETADPDAPSGGRGPLRWLILGTVLIAGAVSVRMLWKRFSV